MALTRPTAAQINSNVEVITDPLSLLNNRGTNNNQDVGFIMNRNGGGVSNVAMFWQESSQRFVFALTSSNGSVNSNVTVTNTANVGVGNIFVSGTMTSSGNLLGTAFAVVGSGAVSNVALGFFPPANTPAEMAIRDYSTANSNMYFDSVMGSGNIGGQFQFRGSNAYTQWARIDRFGIYLPTRPAFRVIGVAGPAQTTANVNLKGVAASVVFNQGSYYDTTSGKFTAPVAGIYSVGLVCRVAVASLSSIGVFKNGVVSSSNQVCYWEADTSTGTATHFGVTGTVILAAGDYLSANITNGSVTFDSNDNWHVTYLG